jgi:hypothetical protein
MRQYLQFRTCKEMQFRQWELCNDYVFGLCKGWCVYAKMEEYSEKLWKVEKDGEKLWKKQDEFNLIMEKARRLGFKE